MTVTAWGRRQGDWKGNSMLIKSRSTIVSRSKSSSYWKNEINEFIWFASPCRIHLIDRSPFVAPDGVVSVSSSFRNLGAFFDEGMSMSDHVNRLAWSCFYHLRCIKFIRRSLTTMTTKMLVSSFIISRVDYYSSILAGIPKYQIGRVQSILNVAARVIYGQARFDHIIALALTPCPWANPVQKVPACVQGTPQIHSGLHHRVLHLCPIRSASMLIFAAVTPCSTPFHNGHAQRAILLFWWPESIG